MATLESLKPDPGSPVPLYHQIAEGIRYRIATGAVAIGTVLPPLRAASAMWGVNLHTVRRAYAELAAQGIVATRAPSGTVVLPGGAPVGREKADRLRAAFLRKVIEEARTRHGLGVPELIAMLEGLRAPGRPGATVFVCECSDTQSADLAKQLEQRWAVEAIPWLIDRPQPPGGAEIIATYFHYNDLRLRWPKGFAGIRFLAISPDPALREQIGSRRGHRTVIVCEREEAMLRNIVADLSRVLPEDRFTLKPRLVRRPGALLEGVGANTPVLIAPRVWGDLREDQKADPRVRAVRYVFNSRDLDAAGRACGWIPRQEA